MTDAQRVDVERVQKFVPAHSGGGMVAVITNAPEHTYVKWGEWADLLQQVAAQAAEIETRREDYATLTAMWQADEAKYRARAEAAERAREEAQAYKDAAFDGNAVFAALTKDATRRTGPENVSDVLDALARVAKAAFLAANGGQENGR